MIVMDTHIWLWWVNRDRLTALGIDIDVFPEICPFAQVDVLNPQYLPEA